MKQNNPNNQNPGPSRPASPPPDGFPDLMIEAELIEYLRISEISRAKDPRNVIDNLKRMHNLPRIPICGRTLYPLKAIREWIDEKTTTQ